MIKINFLKPLLMFFIFLTLQLKTEAKVLNDDEKKKIIKDIKKQQKPIEIFDNSKKAAWMAHALRVDNKDRIDQLYVYKKKIPVFLVPTQKNIRPLVQLRLRYDKEGWSIFDHEKRSLKKTSTDHEYLVYAFLNSRLSTIQLYALGPNDELEEEKIYVFSPEAREFKTKSIFNSLILSTGYAYVNYGQSTFGTFITDSLYFGLNYQSPMNGKRLGYYADLSSTLYTFKSSPVREPSYFLDARLGLSYAVKAFKNPRFRSKIRLGASSVNFFTFGRDFGFTGLFGADFGFSTEYFKNGSESYSFGFSYVPFDYGDFFKERTLRLEVYKNINLKNLRRAKVGIEYSNTTFQYETEAIDAHFFSLKFGLGI